MFTGLVEEKGACSALVALPNGGTRLSISARKITADLEPGASIAVNGCCLTAADFVRGEEVTFDLLEETLARTNLGGLALGAPVNLERSLRVDGRLGGHFVQGHIDCTAPVIDFTRHGADYRIEISLPRQFAQYVVSKGSIAVDGISLTVAEVHLESFVGWIIPHTRAVTNLAEKRANDVVNLEFDLLAKYVERINSLR